MADDPIATSGIIATAFEFLEQRPISSLADSSSKAQSAARAYPRALKAALEVADWSFARRLAALPPVSGTEEEYMIDEDLPFGYVLPGDCVKIRRVEPDGTAWRADERFLRADAGPPLTILYTRLITDEGKLPQTFQIAVAYRLAVLLAPLLVTDLKKKNALIGDAREAETEALFADRGTGSPERYDGLQDQPDWVEYALR